MNKNKIYYYTYTELKQELTKKNDQYLFNDALKHSQTTHFLKKNVEKYI